MSISCHTLAQGYREQSVEVQALVQAFQRNYERCFAFNAVKEEQ